MKMTMKKTATLLAACAASVSGMLALYAVLFYGVCQPWEDDWMAGSLMSCTRVRALALGAASPADRDRLAADLSIDGMTVSRLPPRTDDGGLHASTRIGDTTWWIGFWLPRRAAYWATVATIGVSALVALAMAVAVRATRHRTARHMQRLAHALRARRAALSPIDMPASCSVELEQLVRSFNEWVSVLRRSEQSKLRLLAGVSHDIRTSLARLRLRAEIECDDEVYRAMEEDFKAVTRVIDQFLVYAQGQAGVAVHSSSRPLADLIQQSVWSCRGAGQVRIARMDACPVAAPALPVHRVLSNLIDNALAHGREPVEIELRALDDGAEMLVFDHGQGIAERDFAQALEPFVKLGRGAPSLGHSGLGLAIVVQIAELLGGRVVMKAFDGQRFGMGLHLPGDTHRADTKQRPISPETGLCR